MMEDKSAADSRRRRPLRRVAVEGSATSRQHYREILNPLTPAQVFSTDQIEYIHQSALTLLEQRGLRVLSQRARDVFANGGATVDQDSQIVRLDPGLVALSLTTAPRSVHMIALKDDFSVTVGGRRLLISPVIGPPNVTDLDRGRRPGNMEAFCDFIKLSQHFDVIHVLGPAVEPQDIPIAERHLRVTLAQLQLSDKIPWVFCRGSAQIADCFAMLRIAHGIDEETFRGAARAYTVVNTNSPLQLDIPMAEGIIDFARAGQLVIVTPFTLAGAMAPITLCGALMLAHAEAMAGITLAQIASAGAPVVYGSFTSNVDMKSGSPAFGTPEYTKAAIGAGQLARHIGIPWRCSNATAANSVDAQSAYESQMSIWGAMLGGCNVLLHGSGWLEGGLAASYEKFIVDVEMLQMVAEFCRPVPVSDSELGLEAIADVGPGGHFFGTAHTLERYRTAFYSPIVSDWRNFGSWSDDGGKGTDVRANAIWKKVLAEYSAPKRDAAVVEQLNTYVEKRVVEGGALPAS